MYTRIESQCAAPCGMLCCHRMLRWYAQPCGVHHCTAMPGCTVILRRAVMLLYVVALDGYGPLVLAAAW